VYKRQVEFPRAKRSWLKRLCLEFWGFQALSRELNADVWLSLHDITPRVMARRQAVYCHNPAPFYRAGLREAFWEPRFFMFTLFYRYLYRLNIHANDWVIVQQDWIRQAFHRLYRVRNVVVARPVGVPPAMTGKPRGVTKKVFLYPALPRVFKNFETLCEATRIVRSNTDASFELRLTLSGKESRFAAHLHRRYGQEAAIQWIGRQTPEEMAAQYTEASAVVFPSKLETWGLPITEAKVLEKPLLLADMPYAHETVGDYGQVWFFDPESPEALAKLMLAHLDDTLTPRPHHSPPVAPPLVEDWDALVQFLVANLPSWPSVVGDSE